MLGCAEPAENADLTGEKALLTLEDGAVIQMGGRRYLRADLMNEAQQAELKDPRWWAEPDEVESLAQLLREHVYTPKGYYIEAEPNFELALRIHNKEDPEDSGSDGFNGREDRGVIGDDVRYAISDTSGVGRSIAFSDAGGSGVMYAVDRLYTAAHVVYENENAVEGWICGDGSVSTGPGACVQSWGFGITTPTSIFDAQGYVTCDFNVYVLNSWVNLPDNSDSWLRARYDFARVVFDCNVGSHTSWLGRWNYSDANLPESGVRAAGYPGRYWCPDGSIGNASTCPTNHSTGQGVLQRDWSHTTWATLYYSGTGGLEPGSQQSAHTLRYYRDITEGMSGGPVMSYFTNSNGWTGWHIHGVNASASSTFNRGNRYNSTVKAFLEN